MPGPARFFSDAQQELLRTVSDRVVPPNDRMPGAGEVAVEFLDEFVAAAPARKRQFAEGLALIETEAARVHARDFAGLSGEERDEVLRRVEAAAPAFFDALVRQTYNGYYTNSSVVRLLGLEDRPPQPMGYRLEAGDFSSTERVRGRGQVYREVY